MAHLIIKYLPYNLVLPDATEQTFEVEASLGRARGEYTFTARIKSGPVQLMVQEPDQDPAILLIQANSPAFEVGDKEIISITGAQRKIVAKAATTGVVIINF